MKQSYPESYIRNAKFWGIEETPEFQEACVRYTKILNNISNHLKQELKSGEVEYLNKSSLGVDTTEQPGLIKFKDGRMFTDSFYVDEIVHLFDGVDVLQKGIKTMARSMLQYVCNRFGGYANRNGGSKIPTITFKGKDFHFKDKQLRFENDKITIKTIFGTYELEYSNSIKEDELFEFLKQEGKRWTGGNYIKKQNCIVTQVRIPFEPIYDPQGVLGTDFNKSTNDRIVLSNGYKIAATDRQLELERQIKEVNKILKEKDGPVNNRTMNSKKRRTLRKKQKSLHAAALNAYRESVQEVVDIAKNNQLLLCIDTVKTGQDLGTWGQDKIIPLMITICENSGIPFYAVPCANTSKRCPHCGYIPPEKGQNKNRPSTNEFKCQECSYEEDAQLVGALNIAYFGKEMYHNHVPYSSWGRRSVAKLIEKYKQLEQRQFYSPRQSQVSGFLSERSDKTKSNLSTVKLS